MDDRATPFPCPTCDTEAPAAIINEWTDGATVLRLATHCGRCGVSEVRVYTYVLAAKRIGRDERSVKRWAREGMVMGWAMVDGQRARVVAEDVLLAFYRDKLGNSPVHQYRLRAAAKAEGREYTPHKPLQARKPVARVTGETERQPAVFGRRGKDAISDPTLPAGDRDSDATLQSYEPVVAPVKAEAEYAALNAAIREQGAACSDIDAFTADTITPDTATMLAGICAACPVLEQCAAFAAASRPAAGFWAGQDQRRAVKPRSRVA